MRIISLNCNGIRAAARKGFFEWLSTQQADVVCLQETKSQEHQRGAEFRPAGWHCHYVDALKPGYSGVAILSKREPEQVLTALGDGFADMDAEGRYIEARFGALSVVSLYLPSGSSSEERQQVKFSFMERFLQRLGEWRASGREYVVCGDWNIAHTAADLKNWRGNQKNSGFLPEERAWMDKLFGEAGWVDAWRRLYTDDGDACYTWWSNRGQAWAKNVGWRLDYQVLTPGIAERIRAASVYKEQRFSDHAPLSVDYAQADAPAS